MSSASQKETNKQIPQNQTPELRVNEDGTVIKLFYSEMADSFA